MYCKSLAFTSLVLLATGCSTMSDKQPRFYPNEKLQRVGATQANADAQYCKSLADEYVQNPSKWKDVATNTGGGAVAGTAAGAIGGVILGNTGRGVGVGAATGALLGLIKGLSEAGNSDPNWEKFVEQCLSEKGYRVYNWE
jgi:outer membrane lipoprotein SlyB